MENESMYGYKLTLAYDGTSYSGWQIQPNAPSIQQHLQQVLQPLLHQKELAVIGSGRTDAGVHAKGQVAHFHFDEILDCNQLLYSMNGMLPQTIRIKTIEQVSPHFHARYSAIGKEYHYYLHLDRIMDPFRRLYCWHVRSQFDIDQLYMAANCFIGTHDFTSFANEAHAGSAARNPVRTLQRLTVKSIEGGVCLEFEGNGFLYKMVRNIVGTLVDVALHKISVEAITHIFAAKDRRQASRAAPAQGLFLMHVKYPEGVQ
jgi:tRNA pseudouridine38-40 synthase